MKTKIMIKTESTKQDSRKCKYVGDIGTDGN